MNILIVCETQGRGAGAEKVLEYLLEGWLELGFMSDHPIHLLVPETAGLITFAETHSVPYTIFTGVNSKLTDNLLAAYKFRKHNDLIQWADVIHAWTARAFDLAVLLSSGSAEKWCSGTLHDHPQASFHGFMRQQLMKKAAGKMDGLACVSEAVSKACRSSGYTCRTETVHNGIPTLADAPKEDLKSSPIRLGFLGMYQDWKGFDLVLPWMQRFKNEGIIWKLYGGETPKNRKLLKQAPDNIEVYGWANPQDIWPEIDLLVHASTEFDPFPTVLLEAGAAGLPCLASDLGGAGEIILPGETGRLFSPGEPESGFQQLQKMISSTDQLAEMGQQAKKRIASFFTSNHMAERYLKFWQNLGQNETKSPPTSRFSSGN